MIVPQQKIIWLCSYPKSGNTWMRLFLNALSNKIDHLGEIDSLIGGDAIAASKLLLNDSLGVDTEDLSTDDIQKVRSQAYQYWSSVLKDNTFMKVHDAAYYRGLLLFPYNVTNKVIFIVRNPFDIAVSVSHYLNISIQQSVDAICDEELLVVDRVNGFKSLVPQYLGSWSSHYFSWKTAYGSNMLLIRYEDMLQDGITAFTKVVDYLDWHKSESEIQNAIDSGVTRSNSIAVLAIDGLAYGVFEVGDEIKSESKSAIAQLQKAGINIWLVTGDNQQTALSIGAEAGIASDHIFATASPEDKLVFVENLQVKGKVLMIGDGINDAAALAKADLSIAMGSGTDTAIAAADITLIRSSLHAVIDSLAISRKTVKIIKSNLGWAFFYNIVGIPIAASGNLSPMYAAAAMSCSSLFVVLNSLRIK